MYQSDWPLFDSVDQAALFHTRDQFHHAIQFVSAIGRKFSNEGERERSAALTWIPGLKRLASNWVEGSITFRASISFEDFTIYLVDNKVNTIAQIALQDKSQSQVLIWLEEQIGKLELDASGLTMNLPYKLPDFPTLQKANFQVVPKMMEELSKYFYNSYLALRQLGRDTEVEDVTIRSWPKRFDQAMTILVKDTGEEETNSSLVSGMIFGTEDINEPFFYVRSKPHVDISKLETLPDGMEWFEGTWTGAVLKSRVLIKAVDQREMLTSFYKAASTVLIEQLNA